MTKKCKNNSNNTKLDLLLVNSGKIRDIYRLNDENYLIVASDKISAFDYVLPTLIPNKGKILNKLSIFWFDFTKDLISNHLINGNFNTFPVNLKSYEYLKDRSMIVKKVKKINFECIVRGYLAGSGWKEYIKSQTVCGIKLIKNLKESDKLPEPIFTPSSKEENGKHDTNVTFYELANEIGTETANNLRDISLKLYNKVNNYSISKGIILADTKLEFGFLNDNLVLIDEAFTPDSSRFWEISKYKHNNSQDSLDKQYVRDYLENKVKWNKILPAPNLPKYVINETILKYIEVYEKLTGEKFK
ncbi:MAG: phosphoribosylaminoimidazolesuccinocarboxamide synthase [Endomicrobium sp.]|jgi:phosphoribosylaminoimidazole-succinocarboxamide synthase|nr:phosphoribosylaminoimidazolesuccinocarboxamide synthase [Endomicrobium sp.]